MKAAPFFLFLAAVSAPLSCVSHGQAPASPQGFDAYHIVRTRNIFDPLRSPMLPPGTARAAVVAPAPRASDFVALTGVMVTGEKALAFFSGSRSDYDKVMPINGEIAGAKLTKITAAGIEVNRGGKTISVSVGQTVPFDDSAPTAAPASIGASSGAPPSAAGASQAGPPSIPSNLSEVMRRMMERRQQQLK